MMGFWILQGSQYKTYNKYDLMEAVFKVIDRKVSCEDIAEEYGIPFPYLKEKVDHIEENAGMIISVIGCTLCSVER